MSPGALATFTTVIRGASDAEMHGFIYSVDLDAGRVLGKIAIPQRPFYYGSRGGARGGRGVAKRNGRLYVAVFDRILVYDRDWRLERAIFHPHIVGHHEIWLEDDGIWCCSTLLDAIIKIDFEGKVLDEWWASRDPWFAEHAEGRIVEYDPQTNYAVAAESDTMQFEEQYHFNQVFRHDGRMFAFATNRGILAQFHPTREVVWRTPDWLSAHNAMVLGSRFLLNNTRQKRVDVYEWPPPNRKWWQRQQSWEPIRTVIVDDTIGEASQFATSGWVRGLGVLDEDTVVVGTSPAALCVLDLKRGVVLERFPVSEDVNEAVHGLCIDRG